MLSHASVPWFLLVCMPTMSSTLTPGWPGHLHEIFIAAIMDCHNLSDSKVIEHLILW